MASINKRILSSTKSSCWAAALRPGRPKWIIFTTSIHQNLMHQEKLCTAQIFEFGSEKPSAPPRHTIIVLQSHGTPFVRYYLRFSLFRRDQGVATVHGTIRAVLVGYPYLPPHFMNHDRRGNSRSSMVIVDNIINQEYRLGIPRSMETRILMLNRFSLSPDCGYPLPSTITTVWERRSPGTVD